MRLARLVPKRLQHLIGLKARTHALEEKVRYLVAENVRMNQLLRELIFHNELKRAVTGSQTKESFDYQWREVQEGKSMPSNPEFLAQTPDLLVERTGLPKDWFPGKRVLDAGCGSGRWSYGLLKLGANLVSADQSRGALEATKKLCAGLGSHETLQVDLLKDALPREAFDLVWCFGVCHHTADIMRAMTNVMSAVKPGGWVFMMLYGFPESVDAFSVHAEYEEWRRRLAPLSFEEKVEILKRHYPPEDVHGYFDAYSPLINDLVTWEWIVTFMKERGFESIRRTIDHPNHHFVARKSTTA